MHLDPLQIDETSAGPGLAPEHFAAKVEDKYLQVANHSLRSYAGWQPRVEPFTGIGNTDRIRVLGRVLLSPVRLPGEAHKSRRGIRSYFAVPAPNEKVEITIGKFSTEIKSDRNGYLDFELDLPDDQPMQPGWQKIHFKALRSGIKSKGTVRIIDEHNSKIGVISDIDDTTMVTMVPDIILAVKNTMVTRTSERQAVAGMSAFYQRIDQVYPNAPFVYLSSGAWNTAHTLRKFLAHHGYPAGPLLLTDFGPTRTGWFRSGKAHKKSQITFLMDLAPNIQWFMFGDDGQEDPEIYTEACERFPGRVKAIGIRTLSPVERVLWVRRGNRPPTHGEKKDRQTNLPKDVIPEPESGFDTPLIEGPDGQALTAAFSKFGLI